MELPDKLKNELQGILTWGVKGSKKWLENGLGLPEEIKEATEEYRDEMDVFGAFLAEICHILPEAQVKSSNLHAAYTEWAKTYGETAINKTNFGIRLTELGFQRFTNNGVWYRGIGLHDRTEGTEGFEPKTTIAGRAATTRSLMVENPSVPSVPSVDGEKGSDIASKKDIDGSSDKNESDTAQALNTPMKVGRHEGHPDPCGGTWWLNSMTGRTTCDTCHRSY